MLSKPSSIATVWTAVSYSSAMSSDSQLIGDSTWSLVIKRVRRPYIAQKRIAVE